jgi:hypothetical protein
MKTPVRKTVHNSTAGPYNLMYIEILVPRYEGTNYLEPAGVITFQQNIGEDSWYGLTFKVETDSVKHMDKMTKLAKLIKKSFSYDVQPKQILDLIGADEHVHYQSDFISTSKNGQNYYKVIVNGDYYKSIIAPSDKVAIKEMTKLNIAGATLELKGKICI